MKPTKSLLAGLAAAGLLFSQTAVAAPQRTGSAVTDSEQFSGRGIFIGAIAAIAITMAVLIATGTDDETMPVSP